MFFVNVGLTRCATSKLHTLIEKEKLISVPNKKKELNFFLKNNHTDAVMYLENFDINSINFFESSPAYCHNGVISYEKILSNIHEALGSDVCFVFLLRNLVERAFSHYWYMISHHHAMYGESWKVKRKDHPNRYSKVFKDSFSKFLMKNSLDFLFPEIDEMIKATIDLFGKDKVIVALSEDVDEVARSMVNKIITPKLNANYESGFYNVRTEKVNISSIPVIQLNDTVDSLLLTINNSEYKLESGDLLVSDARSVDILKKEVWGSDKLNEIFSSQYSWSTKIDATELPEYIKRHINKIALSLREIPDVCFINKEKCLGLISLNPLVVRK